MKMPYLPKKNGLFNNFMLVVVPYILGYCHWQMELSDCFTVVWITILIVSLFFPLNPVAPICYAHLAASQMGQFMKFEDASETSSSQGGLTSAGPVAVPQLPRLQEKVCNSMFFCWRLYLPFPSDTFQERWLFFTRTGFFVLRVLGTPIILFCGGWAPALSVWIFSETWPEMVVSFSVYIMLRYFKCGHPLGEVQPWKLYTAVKDWHEHLLILLSELVSIT